MTGAFFQSKTIFLKLYYFEMTFIVSRVMREDDVLSVCSAALRFDNMSEA